MNRLVCLIGLLTMFSSLCWADIVCHDKVSGLYEYEGASQPGSCLKNWITDNPQYGFQSDQIEELVITPEQWKSTYKKLVLDDPNALIHDQAEANRKVKETASKAKLGLSDQQFQDLKDALK